MDRPVFRFARQAIGIGASVSFSVASALLFRSVGLGVPAQVLTLALGVVAAAMAGRVAGLTASVLVILAFNWGFTSPLYSLLVDDPQNYLVFALFLVTGIVIGSLSDRLRQVARAQARVAGEAQTARLYEGFSHDLRTPLAVIGGTAASLKATLADRVDEGSLDRLATIEKESRNLGRQVDNLLELSRLAADWSGWALVLVPAEELLFSCRDRCAGWMTDRRLEVDPPAGVPLVRVEPSLVEQALLNLVENADRYAPAGTPVRLSLGRGGSWVELTVADQGPGVPDAEKKAIFGRFVRGSVAQGASGRRGTGLGLALVAEVARLHGGSAGVRDRAGGGSEFWLRLPAGGAP